jgi:hypothetical protein
MNCMIHFIIRVASDAILWLRNRNRVSGENRNLRSILFLWFCIHSECNPDTTENARITSQIVSENRVRIVFFQHKPMHVPTQNTET